ncbi:MAG: ATP cone domain-containing protein, partial [Nocardioidaceae bacterium]
MTDTISSTDTAPDPTAPDLVVIRRDGGTAPFDPGRIALAVGKAFLAVEGSDAAASARVRAQVEQVTEAVRAVLQRRAAMERSVHVEDIQDQVELALMRGGYHKVARAYVLYREEHARLREQSATVDDESGTGIRVRLADGTRAPLDGDRLRLVVDEACAGLADVDAESVVAEVQRNVYDGITVDELALA